MSPKILNYVGEIAPAHITADIHPRGRGRRRMRRSDEGGVAAAASVDSGRESVPAHLVRIRRSQRRTRECRPTRKRTDQKE